MKIFNKLIRKNEINQNESSSNKENITNLVELNNYMLSDVRKEDLSKNCYSISISDIAKINPKAIPVAHAIKTITQENTTNNGRKLYCVTNLGENDSLKIAKDGKTIWGAIKKSDGTSAMAKLKEIQPSGILKLDPTIMMMTIALSGIESELGEIKEQNKKIFKFLEEEKEAEVESDLEILNRSIEEFKYNLDEEKYLINHHKQIMDIKRSANNNMLFYKKQIRDSLSKYKLLIMNKGMNSILEEIEKKIKYYRLSLYIYSFSTLLEILLIGNYQSEYLLAKSKELKELDNEFSKTFNETMKYVKKNADKSIEGNVLSGLGTAEKAIGNLAEKIKVKKVDNWLNKKGDDLRQTGKNIKENFTNRLEKIRESNSVLFISQIEKMDVIYNKTKEIYFDDKNIYLEAGKEEK